ncbi:MAG: hypothetical protein ICCCNLDF_02017 [Planctomycetes bacterium]|nr:hypothetical protein [Planctomycetota bacterium]
MHKWFFSTVVVLASVFLCGTVRAEDTLQFPRIRQLQDLVQRASDSRYKDQGGLLGQDAFSLGFSAGYISDHYWRGFRLFDADVLCRGDAYVNLYGFEASVWAMWDPSNDRYRPVQADYRFRYKFEIEGALISVGYTWYDFSGSDGDLGARDQGFGRNPLKQFPDDKFPNSIHELHIMMTYFTSVLQSEGANLRYTLNYFQRLDDEGSRIESTVSLFVDSPTFTIFGDYFEITTTTIYQHRYLTNRSEFQGQISTARIVYNLDKYNLFPMFFQLEAHYYVAFDDDYVDGFYFGGSVNFRF